MAATGLTGRADLGQGGPARIDSNPRHLLGVVEALNLCQGWNEVAGATWWEDLAHLLLHAHAGHSLHVLGGEVGLAVLLALGQGDAKVYETKASSIT